MIFLGWYDPDKKVLPRAKLQDAIDRYVEKYDRTPRYCLTSVRDAEDLAKPSRKFPDLPLTVLAKPYVARFTFYIGETTEEMA